MHSTYILNSVGCSPTYGLKVYLLYIKAYFTLLFLEKYLQNIWEFRRSISIYFFFSAIIQNVERLGRECMVLYI